jgi:hypothetical protein
VPIDKGNVGQRDTRIADMDVLITQQHFSAEPKDLRGEKNFQRPISAGEEFTSMKIYARFLSSDRVYPLLQVALLPVECPVTIQMDKALPYCMVIKGGVLAD